MEESWELTQKSQIKGQSLISSLYSCDTSSLDKRFSETLGLKRSNFYEYIQIQVFSLQKRKIEAWLGLNL